MIVGINMNCTLNLVAHMRSTDMSTLFVNHTNIPIVHEGKEHREMLS